MTASPPPASLPPRIAVTAGEPAGIGPDLCVMLAAKSLPARIVVLGDKEVLAARARSLGVGWDVPDYAPAANVPLSIANIRVHAAVQPGRLLRANAPYVLALLDCAVDGCTSGEFAAMVTAPVQKSVINDAGIAFTGHTEYLQHRADAPHVVMLLAGRMGSSGQPLRVALATTHLALAEVPRAITAKSLTDTLRVLHRDLVDRFRIGTPRILVSGLNPHAGEGGHLGREEIDVISPVINQLKGEGMALFGPLPADTLFTQKFLDQADAVLVMYHDQGLPVLKHATFGVGVNITLGLPFIRTSVDHGTALDLAGTGKADAGSLVAAVELAIEIAGRRP